MTRVAIVTGGTRGIGKGICLALKGKGMTVIANYARDDTAAAAFTEETGIPAYKWNVGDHEATIEGCARVAAEVGLIDVLVNNAGGGIIQPFLDHTPETLRETVKRNLWTTVWSTYYALPHMVRANYGRIVNIGADSVRNGLWDHAGYNAAKGGVHGMTTGLAREFGAQDITVNTVAPCAVNTERMRSRVAYDEAMADKFTSVIPKGRPAELVEISSMVVHLCKPESAFVTGQVISVNGGSTML